jgi:hypothetical protein
MKRKSRALILVLAFLCGVTAFILFFVFSDAVPADKFAQVSVGMTQEEVKTLIGVPDVIRPGPPTTFFYGGFQRAKFCTMEVYFGVDGRVVRKFHDH